MPIKDTRWEIRVLSFVAKMWHYESDNSKDGENVTNIWKKSSDTADEGSHGDVLNWQPCQY